MKTSELTGAHLDCWVAKAEGHKGAIVGPRFLVHERSDGLHVGMPGGGWHFAPSTEWKHGGPIIERRKIMVAWNVDHWISGSHETTERPGGHIWSGRTALIAAMRVCVAAAFGEEVPESPQ